MKKNNTSKKLENRARLEIQKIESGTSDHEAKEQQAKNTAKKLKNDVERRDKLILDKIEPSLLLKDRIAQRQALLDDIAAEVNNNHTEQFNVVDFVRQLIAELRKYNPRKARELEQAFIIKKGLKKRRDVK